MYHLKKYKLTDLTGLDANTPGYVYTRRDADWFMHDYVNKSLTVNLENNIKNVVFTDDDAYLWIKNYPYKLFCLPGNSVITVISVLPNTKIKYGYHHLNIIY